MNTTTTAKKIIRVKSKTRFTIFMILSLFLAAFMINTIIGSNSATALESGAKTGPSAITVTVNSGDNLWDIANEYKSEDMDVREAVYIIKDANNMKQSGLTAGTDLIIPVSELQ